MRKSFRVAVSKAMGRPTMARTRPEALGVPMVPITGSGSSRAFPPLAEGAAQPVGSLRVRGMRALSVWQRDASIAGRDLN